MRNDSHRASLARSLAAGLACLLLAAMGWIALEREDPGGAIEVRDVDPASFPIGSTMRRLAERGAMTVGTKFDQPLLSALGPDGRPASRRPGDGA